MSGGVRRDAAPPPRRSAPPPRARSTRRTLELYNIFLSPVNCARDLTRGNLASRAKALERSAPSRESWKPVGMVHASPARLAAMRAAVAKLSRPVPRARVVVA